MLRPEEMAFLTEQMRLQIKKHQLASKESNIITWDGNTEGRHTIPIDENSYMCKVSDTPVKVTKENIKSFSVYDLTYTNEDFEVVSDVTEDGATMTLATVLGYHLFTVADKDVYVDGTLIAEKGVYFVSSYTDNYNNYRLELETIHPIPQEYIPPLDALYLNGTDGVRYKLYVDAAGQLQVEVV